MHPRKLRFVAGTQQILVIGAVFAALVPAANVVSLDVVRDHPSSGSATGDSPATSATTALAAYQTVADQAAQVPTSSVEANVREIALTAPAKGMKPALTSATGDSAHSAVYLASSDR